MEKCRTFERYVDKAKNLPELKVFIQSISDPDPNP